MGFDDFFEHDHHHQRNDHRYNSRFNEYDHGYHRHDRNHDLKFLFLNGIRSNKQMRGIAIVVLLIAIIVVVFLIVLLMPIVLKVFEFIGDHGIQGIIDLIWKGSK